MRSRAKVAVLALIAAALLAGCAGDSQGARVQAGTSEMGATTSSTRAPLATTTTTTTTTATTTSGRPHPAQRRIDDGSLGSQPTRAACTLLSRAEIRAEFGGPVGRATPTYPYCEWLVGADAFLALDFQPGVSFQSATRWVGTLATVSGVGSHAVIGDNRYLYFSDGRSSYWLLWQQVGDFSGLHEQQLTTLARDVLAHRAAPSHLGASRAGGSGPPIYFAGDSTAAGPEWAWVTYHASSPALRTLAEYQVGSGLVVPAYFNWPRHLLAVAAAEHPKLVIYMGSANDGQDLPWRGGFAVVGSPEWKKVYGERVGNTMSELTREGAKVLWIGEPAMQNAALSADMLDVDQVCQAEAARHPGVTWFNPGSILNLPGWRYSPTVDIAGREIDVRLDGVHLNAPGSVYLADAIAPIVKKILRVR